MERLKPYPEKSLALSLPFVLYLVSFSKSCSSSPFVVVVGVKTNEFTFMHCFSFHTLVAARETKAP